MKTLILLLLPILSFGQINKSISLNKIIKCDYGVVLSYNANGDTTILLATDYGVIHPLVEKLGDYLKDCHNDSVVYLKQVSPPVYTDTITGITTSPAIYIKPIKAWRHREPTLTDFYLWLKKKYY